MLNFVIELTILRVATKKGTPLTGDSELLFSTEGYLIANVTLKGGVIITAFQYFFLKPYHLPSLFEVDHFLSIG